MTQEQMLKKIYEQGQSAFFDGLKEEDNPYYHTPERLSMWNKGYHDAQDNIEDWAAAQEIENVDNAKEDNWFSITDE